MAEIEKHDDSTDRFALLRPSLDLVRAAEDWDTAILVVADAGSFEMIPKHLNDN